MSNKNSMIVLVVEPKKLPYLKIIDSGLEAMQAVVDGYIEQCMPFEDDVAIICNEEGKINRMPLNRPVFNIQGEIVDVIAGTFFMCYVPPESEHFLSITEDLACKYAKRFMAPCEFLSSAFIVLDTELEENEFLANIKTQYYKLLKEVEME